MDEFPHASASGNESAPSCPMASVDTHLHGHTQTGPYRDLGTRAPEAKSSEGQEHPQAIDFDSGITDITQESREVDAQGASVDTGRTEVFHGNANVQPEETDLNRRLSQTSCGPGERHGREICLDTEASCIDGICLGESTTSTQETGAQIMHENAKESSLAPKGELKKKRNTNIKNEHLLY